MSSSARIPYKGGMISAEYEQTSLYGGGSRHTFSIPRRAIKVSGASIDEATKAAVAALEARDQARERESMLV